MGNFFTNIASIQQNFMNNILQEQQQNCIATATNTANNNVIIVTGSKFNGDFTGVSATTSTDATCLMVSSMENNLSNILSATLQQTNSSETDLFNDFNFGAGTNAFNIDQSITNNISQINEVTCAAASTSSANNNYAYISNSQFGGNFVGVSTVSNASANCSMNNTMKNTTYNQAQASGDQSNSTEGMFVAILAAIGAIVALVIIGVIFMYSTGALSKVGYKNGEPELSQEQKDLLAAQDLGLSSEDLQALVNAENNPAPVPAATA